MCPDVAMVTAMCVYLVGVSCPSHGQPASYTRLTALLFAEICAESGLPPGVFNVVTGNGAFGHAVSSDTPLSG